ncbi:hypothetical protein [Leucothrix arctica]|uniref:DUF4177 domain-containing protein n=1 Tax=Leucothrix arctica TaxID=1481894 RepID=A0A317CL09_9GAMM|nr:hypothetical protein [Leucothrix arctica]PWQ99255.1 hypothetical protein DKT75_01535 [Leucothrix arctica]
MKKLMSLIILSAALISISSQAYSKELLICQQEGYSSTVQCTGEKEDLQLDIYKLVKQGWSIVSVVPAMWHSGGKEIRIVRIFLVK